MLISGLQKTTLLDYPQKVACTIFLGGCNMRCRFCHNMDIVENATPFCTEEEVLQFLQKRKGVLEGVCITGGEPTLQPDLPDMIRKIKDLSLCVKLDTNGTNPQMLRQLIDSKLIDYVAMDIKTSLSEYDSICNAHIDTDAIKESVSILKESDIPYEFRTTVIAEYHNDTTFTEIADWLQGCPAYYLQAFVDSDYVPDHSLSAPDKDTLMSYVDILRQKINTVEIRGVD